jgi:thiamine-phosphate pyrophosphorylase
MAELTDHVQSNDFRSKRPVLCLVTDRRRLLGAASRDTSCERLIELTREAVDAGIDIIQIRERDLESAALVDLVATIVEIAKGSSTRVVVNDRLDVAVASGAGGVHLRADSITPRAARSIAPAGFVVGRSVHNASEAARHADGTNYLIAGTVFPTPSKPTSQQLLGTNGLTDVVRAVHVPILAIGGITIERADQVAATGAAGLAAISLFLPSPSRTIVRVVEELRARFDSPIPAS